ncbi:DUF1624 domain-containing protein [Paracnuella aquatica]|uniref:DUF1624 domain-containing protein n=1 Tax=Paracnuella aquatica TaxID=2268757 RepID=UPI000DEEE0EB|nr:heparan-alpha-glucosaminide N-acetyltransferase domain-containing protein [Paracnuella aquatica]RPD50789.1 DUF1624 domain-containing protein [Paracnuella aquatica]
MQATALSTPPAPPPVLRNYRISSIDALRGLVMIIMALDHARDLLHFGALTEDPANLQTTTPWLFATRWITHFCAPVFVALSGTSIYLQSRRKSKGQLSAFLLKRGLWLILVEITLVTFGISFDPGWTFIFLQVIWAIGISMVILAGLIWLPFGVLLALGALILLGHNALDGAEAAGQAPQNLLYSLLHRQAFIPFGNGHVLGILYPFLPWTGIMLLGYCLGKLYQLEAALRRKWLAGLGAGAVLLFILLRATNAYGDPLPWAPQANGLRTALSFVNTQKYPPSLLFTCMTLGPALLLLALADGWRNAFTRITTVFGRVPFFYYILHFYILHGIAAMIFLAKGGTIAEGLKGAEGVPFKFVVPGVGLHLWQVYLTWLAVVALLYPLCLWYGNLKKRKDWWWLSYL